LIPEAFRLYSFSRRIGKGLRPAQKLLMSEALPRYAIALPLTLPAGELWLEIGYGNGEHLAMQAKLHPEINFIGCEPYINGVVQMLKSIVTDDLKNIRLWNDDAITLLEQLPDHALTRIYILFPDPWPKTRQQKRRIISDSTLDLLAKKMKPGGRLQLATDHVEYAEWMAEHLNRHALFTLHPENGRQPEDWTKTRYQEKTEKEGRAPVFYLYQRK